MNTKTTRQAAVLHRIELVQWRTEEIRAEEAKVDWDADALRRLYALRLSHIIEALELGVEPTFLSMITGNQA